MENSLESLTQSFLESYFSFYPVTASHLGWNGHDEDLACYLPDRIDTQLKNWQEIADKTKDVATPSIKDNINKELLARFIERQIFSLAIEQHHKRNPAGTIDELADSCWSLMMGQHRSAAQKTTALVARLQSIPNFIHEATQRHKSPVRLWTHIAIEEAPGLINYLASTVRPYLETHNVAGSTTLVESACHHIDDFVTHLKQLQNTQQDFSIGKTHFDYLLNRYHCFEETAMEIRERGIEQINLITKQLEKHAAEMDSAKSWPELVETLKQEHPTEENLLNSYREKVDEIKHFLSENNIVTLPDRESLQVIETPEFLQSSIPYAAYSMPTMFAEDDRGTFYVSPAKGNQEILQEHCYAAFPLTALHEAYPGHHLQFSLQRTLNHAIRKVYDVASYYEGWTLYCEEMMYRQGFYNDAMRLYQLKDRLWRAARIVVDVSMHCNNMSDQEAADFLVKHAQLSPQGARIDVNWYTQSPTTPLSYLTGMLEVDRMRRDYEAAGHSLREFHDAFLQCGAIPLKFVRALLFNETI